MISTYLFLAIEQGHPFWWHIARFFVILPLWIICAVYWTIVVLMWAVAGLLYLSSPFLVVYLVYRWIRRN